MAGFLQKLTSGLSRTAGKLGGGLKSLIGRKVDADFLTKLEEHLLAADVGVDATDKILEDVRLAYSSREADEGLTAYVKQSMRSLLADDAGALNLQADGPTVILVAGVNGSGKTTSIAKLSRHLAGRGKKVILGAGDTFRAAAIEQLATWGERTGAEVVKGKPGADPAAVAHDTCSALKARGADVAIIDTAGRLHTQANLMQELQKVHRVIGKVIPGAPHEVLLVLDATNGQNAIQQARHFTDAIDCTGIVLSKLDGTAKGGAVVAIRDRLGLPVKFVGVGEGADDLQAFDPAQFVEALFAEPPA